MLATARKHWHWGIPTVVVCALLWPLLTSDRTFASDWGNHLWLVSVQAANLEDLGTPSFFIQSTLGAFYPYFAFYGGTLYTVLGLFSLLLSPEAAVTLAFAAALAAAYLGWTWIAHLVGVRGWLVQIPGCIAVTAPYAVTNLYGRGDIPEMVATSTIPLAAASALALLMAPRVRFWPAAAFVASVAVLTGTHTLTLIWGTTFLLLCAAIAIAANWAQVRSHSKRFLRLAWLGALGVGLNAWILVPLILFHARIREVEPDPLVLLDYTDKSQLFSFFRDGAGLHLELTGDIDAQLPVLALLWVLAFGIVYRAFLPRNFKWIATGLAVVGSAFLLLIVAPSLIESLPKAWRFIQFPYRVLTFVDLAVVGLIVLTLFAMQRAGRSARAPALMLAGVAIVALVLSVRQDSQVRSWLPGRDDATASSVKPPPTWYAPLQFADGSAPIVHPTLNAPLRISPAAGRANSYAVTYPAGSAGTVRTNILTGTYFIDVTGARPVGRTDEGAMVLHLSASGKQRVVTVKAAWSTAVEVGRWLSLLALLICVGATFYVLTVRLMDRRDASA